jgi:uncharacterized membrane protein YphA (DoxX/SURF4 family)
MNIGYWTLTALLIAVFAVSGVAKILNLGWSQRNAEHLGITTTMSRSIGILEAVAVVGLVAGLFYKPLSIATAAGVVGLMIGAVGYHLRAKDGFGKVVPAVATTAMAVGLVGFAL